MPDVMGMGYGNLLKSHGNFPATWEKTEETVCVCLSFLRISMLCYLWTPDVCDIVCVQATVCLLFCASQTLDDGKPCRQSDGDTAFVLLFHGFNLRKVSVSSPTWCFQLFCECVSRMFHYLFIYRVCFRCTLAFIDRPTFPPQPSVKKF